MSLRQRLLLTIGASFAIFWTLSSVWMLIDLRTEFRDALDERLAASARMVAALVADTPQLAAGSAALSSIPTPVRTDGVACEIRQLRGALIGRTHNSPANLGSGALGFQTRTIDGVGWRSYTLERNGIRITTADRVQRRTQLLHDIALTTFVPFLIAMIASMLALWFAVRRGLRPLESIRGALAARAPDALQPLSEQGVPPELAPLVTTVNALLGQIERAIERERRFTGDAAHELRTPLTAVKTHIQVARLSGVSDSADTALGQAEEGVRRLHRTIDQLLMLARLEGPFSFDEDERLTARAAAEGALAQLAPAALQRVAIVDAGGGLSVPAIPASLAMTALRNLIDNAVRYGSDHGQVTLRIGAAQDLVWFRVEDQGGGLSAADLGRAGQRFWRKGQGHGSGLGLSIVHAIVSRYGGSWELRPGPGGGLAARITLPAPGTRP